MKKLMTIAAAALCTTVFGAIESTNVVGYHNNTANATKNTMMAPTFLGVGNADGCTLADLKVTGYDAPVWNANDDEYVGGCSVGDFDVKFLSNDGTVAARYFWVDDGETGPAWCNGSGTPIDATQVAIKAGMAAWISGAGMKLQSAGAVNKEDVQFTMNATRNTAVGNSMPMTITLADLTVDGYTVPVWNDNDDEYTGGCSLGDFDLKFLNNDGSVAARYYWVDDGETGPAWCDKTGSVIDGTKVEIPAGKGMWIQGSGMNLNIPAPKL